MPELDWISVKGFKSISSIEKLKLGAINVVIGANGSGKSNFIGVFSFLHALKEGHLQEYVVALAARTEFCTSALNGPKCCLSMPHSRMNEINIVFLLFPRILMSSRR